MTRYTAALVMTRLSGGAGNDTIVQSGSGTQHYDGGAGVDTYKIDTGFLGEEFNAPIKVDLTTGFSGLLEFPDHALNDTLVNFENIDFGSMVTALELVGDDADNVLTAGSGDDTLTGGAGDDTLTGGDGEDTLNGGDGDDTLSTGSGDDRLFGEGGDDRLIINGSGAATLDGGDGSDTVQLDLTNYTPTIDGFVAEINLATGISGAVGVDSPLEDKLISIENIDYRGPLASQLIGDEGDNIISGGSGDDTNLTQVMTFFEVELVTILSTGVLATISYMAAQATIL